MNDKYITCLDCPDRCASPNCHTTCEGYIARHKKWEERRQKRLKQNILESYTVDTMHKSKRKKRKNGMGKDDYE